MRLDPAIIRHQIENLLIQCPELAEDEVLRADMIEGETEAHEFLRTVEIRRQATHILANALATYIAELSVRMARFERRETSMRELAFKVMSAANLRKIEMPEATYSIRAGTPKVVIIDEAQLPADAFRIKKEVDRQTIKSWLNAGQEVPGATLSNAEQTLSIRTK